jgi:hypothetical protein
MLCMHKRISNKIDYYKFWKEWVKGARLEISKDYTIMRIHEL